MSTTSSTTETCNQLLARPGAWLLVRTSRGVLIISFIVVLLAGLVTLSGREKVGVGDSALKVASSGPIAPPFILGVAGMTADDVVERRAHQATGANGWLRDRFSDEARRKGGGRPWQRRPSPQSFAPSLTSQEQAELEQFLADCEYRVDAWRHGQASYPGTLTIRLHQMATFRVKVDVNANGMQHSSPSDDIRVANLRVRCGMGARLTSLDSGLVIEDEGDWIKREFDASGAVEWVWTVQANGAESGQVRLDFRPAVEVVHGGWVVPGNEDSGFLTETYTSNIAVETPVLDTADNWFKNDFPKIGGIATIAGAALIALVAWVRKLLRTARDQEDESTERSSGSLQRVQRGRRLCRQRYSTVKARRSKSDEP